MWLCQSHAQCKPTWYGHRRFSRVNIEQNLEQTRILVFSLSWSLAAFIMHTPRQLCSSTRCSLGSGLSLSISYFSECWRCLITTYRFKITGSRFFSLRDLYFNISITEYLYFDDVYGRKYTCRTSHNINTTSYGPCIVHILVVASFSSWFFNASWSPHWLSESSPCNPTPSNPILIPTTDVIVTRAPWISLFRCMCIMEGTVRGASGSSCVKISSELWNKEVPCQLRERLGLNYWVHY